MKLLVEVGPCRRVRLPRLDNPGSLLVASGRLFISVVVGGLLMLALFDGAPPESVQPRWFTMVELGLLEPAAVCGGGARRWSDAL